jgi:hypothetical protein
MSTDGKVVKCNCCLNPLKEADFEEHARRAEIAAAYPGKKIIQDGNKCQVCLMEATCAQSLVMSRRIEGESITWTEQNYATQNGD